MKLKAVIIEDEPIDARHLKGVLAGLPDVEVIALYRDVPNALASLKAFGHVDLIFSDIELPGTNGMDAAKWLKTYADTLVFVTGHTEYALDALKQFCKYYLVKPVSPEDVIEVLEDCFGADPDRYPIRLKFGKVALYDAGKKRYLPVVPEEIIKITADGNYLSVAIKGADKPVVIRYTIQAAANVLEPFGLFMQISRDVIVNLSHIDTAGLDSVLCGGSEHSVSKKHLEAHLKFWRSHQLGSGNQVK